jgi:gliding motility-associated lipoprotein GldB
MAVFIVLFFFLSCNSDKKKKIDVSNIDVPYSIDRFDKDFYSSTKENLEELKKKYPFFFSEEITDSITVSKITNKDEQELFRETQKLYTDFSSIEKQLTSLFKHVKFYNSKFVAPKVITMLTNIDYGSRVIYADSLLIISLDVYLGKNHPFYADYPKYIKENNTKNHLIVDVANTIIAKQLPPNLDRSFLGKMMYEGKKMYLLDVYLPEIKDKEKVGYEKEKLDWAEANEEQIWMYFIEKNLLFSTDTKLNKRFLEIAPFSKFYMAQDNLSPGRIGVWVGWQIVRSYMQHNTVSLQELLETNTLDIYKNSKYKPKK